MSSQRGDRRGNTPVTMLVIPQESLYIDQGKKLGCYAFVAVSHLELELAVVNRISEEYKL
jgi:hypothetical protein